MSSINVEAILNNPESLLCNNEGSRYVDKDHVVDQRACSNWWSSYKFCKIFCKVPKFKEGECTDLKKSKTSIVEGIDDCINTWYTKKGISKISFMEWKTAVIKQTDKKIVELKTESACHQVSTN